MDNDILAGMATTSNHICLTHTVRTGKQGTVTDPLNPRVCYRSSMMKEVVIKRQFANTMCLLSGPSSSDCLRIRVMET